MTNAQDSSFSKLHCLLRMLRSAPSPPSPPGQFQSPDTFNASFSSSRVRFHLLQSRAHTTPLCVRNLPGALHTLYTQKFLLRGCAGSAHSLASFNCPAMRAAMSQKFFCNFLLLDNLDLSICWTMLAGFVFCAGLEH